MLGKATNVFDGLLSSRGDAQKDNPPAGPGEEYTMIQTDLPSLLSVSELARLLGGEGYKIGFPRDIPSTAIRDDRLTAEASQCDHCGCRGLEYLPLRSKDHRRRGYRAVAWCSTCDAAFEL